MLIIAISVQTGEPNGKWYRSVGVTAGKSVWSPETFNRTPIKYIASLPPLVDHAVGLRGTGRDANGSAKKLATFAERVERVTRRWECLLHYFGVPGGVAAAAVELLEQKFMSTFRCWLAGNKLLPCNGKTRKTLNYYRSEK